MVGFLTSSASCLRLSVCVYCANRRNNLIDYDDYVLGYDVLRQVKRRYRLLNFRDLVDSTELCARLVADEQGRARAATV